MSGAGNPWADSEEAPQCAVRLCFEAFTDLACISAEFAARLVHAGALTALMRLLDKVVAQRTAAVRHGAPEGAHDGPAPTKKVVMGCFTSVGRLVPQVSCRPRCRSGCVLWLHVLRLWGVFTSCTQTWHT